MDSAPGTVAPAALTGRASPPEGGAQARPGSVTARVNGTQFVSLNWMYGVAPDTAEHAPSVRLFVSPVVPALDAQVGAAVEPY